MTTEHPTVNFTRMDQGTAEDYALLQRASEEFNEDLTDKVLAMLDELKDVQRGYQVNRYVHSLQSATLAYDDGADEETIVAALLHDIGDHISPENHSALAASVLQPYVSERMWWIVHHHGLFQGYYFWHHYGMDRNARDAYRDHPYYGLHRVVRQVRPARLRPGLPHQAAELLRADGAPALRPQALGGIGPRPQRPGRRPRRLGSLPVSISGDLCTARRGSGPVSCASAGQSGHSRRPPWQWPCLLRVRRAIGRSPAPAVAVALSPARPQGNWPLPGARRSRSAQLPRGRGVSPWHPA